VSVLAMFFVVLVSVLLVVGTGIWAMERGEFWPASVVRWVRRRCKRRDEEKHGPEIGTIRIVEKMRDDESVYYIAKRYDWYYGSLQWAQYPESGRFDTPEEAQEAANTEFEKEQKKAEKKAEKKRRANYEKVMGEFKP